jgi:hypothetical protein
MAGSIRRTAVVLMTGFAALMGLVVLGAQPAQAVPILGGTQWLLYWNWSGQVQKGPCALLFNANGSLAGDHDGNCTTTTGHWQLSGSTLNFSLAHSCGSQWTATYDSSNNEFDNGTMQALGPTCGGNFGTFWLSKAGRIDGITFNGTAASPSIVITGRQFGTEPASAPVPSACSATGVDFPGNPFYLDDVSAGWSAGMTGDCIGLQVSTYTTTKTAYTFGSYYGRVPSDVLTAGDQLTVGVHSRTVLAYVDGFTGAAGAEATSPGVVDSPATT